MKAADTAHPQIFFKGKKKRKKVLQSLLVRHGPLNVVELYPERFCGMLNGL